MVILIMKLADAANLLVSLYNSQSKKSKMYNGEKLLTMVPVRNDNFKPKIEHDVEHHKYTF